jgi:menaquinone-dependent protoporphyrinogen oxidase
MAGIGHSQKYLVNINSSEQTFILRIIMKKILVAYTTNSGSTEDVAKVITEELGRNGDQVTISRLEEINRITGYDAVIVGAPMILGWHRSARKFIKQNQSNLSRIPVAYFCTAMTLTVPEGYSETTTPVYIDASLAKLPKREGRLDIKESYTLASNYLKPILASAPAVKPVSVGFFGGRLDLYKLKLLQMLFVMVIIGAQPGDMRNYPAIREWAARLRDSMFLIR